MPLWSQLDFARRHEFRWSVGETPLSELTFVAAAAVAYHVLVWTLHVSLSARVAWVKRAAAVHNLFLAAISLVTVVGLAYDSYAFLGTHSAREAFCAVAEEELQSALWYWVYIAYLTKFYELVDTVILVLLRAPLTFLHVYHHTIVPFMVWSMLSSGVAMASWGVMANSTIHVFMYTHYFLQSAARSPKWFKVFVTQAQIVQFVWSFIGSSPYLYFLFANRTRDGPWWELFTTDEPWFCLGKSAFWFNTACNMSFLLLFVRFYVNTYKAKQQARKKKQT